MVTTVSPRPVQCRSDEPNDRELFGRVYRQARCATSRLEPDEWFPLTADVGQAREQAARAIAICAGCPVRADCMELSLRHAFGIGAYGVWGGLCRRGTPGAAAPSAGRSDQSLKTARRSCPAGSSDLEGRRQIVVDDQDNLPWDVVLLHCAVRLGRVLPVVHG